MSHDLQIAIIGQAAFGESVLNALVEEGYSIVGVFCPPDKEGKAFDPLKTAAVAHDIPVFQFSRLRDQEAIDAFEGLKADLCVMAFVTDIVPMAMLEAPAQGTIQYHPSLLPKHRGPSSINWPVIQGESKTGLSIFWPDEGLDTGPILLQKEVDILEEDTLGTLYFQKLFTLGVDAMVESVALVEAGTAPRIVQDESEATYEGWVKADEARIDWGGSAETIFNLVRGCDPSPGANTLCKGETVQLFGARSSADSTGIPSGTIVSIEENGMTIAAGDESLLIRKVRAPGGAKVSAAEWAGEKGIGAGEVLGQ
jgi:methionyl-tRNA formyltransferase